MQMREKKMDRENSETEGKYQELAKTALARAGQSVGLEFNPFVAEIKLRAFGKDKGKAIPIVLERNNYGFEYSFNSQLRKFFVQNGPVWIERVDIRTVNPQKTHYVNEKFFAGFLDNKEIWLREINASFLNDSTVNVLYATPEESEKSIRIIEGIRKKLKVIVGSPPELGEKIDRGKFTIAKSEAADSARRVFEFLFSDRVPFVRLHKTRVLVIRSSDDASNPVLLYRKTEEIGRFVKASQDTTKTAEGMVFYRPLTGGSPITMPAGAVYTLLQSSDPTIDEIESILFSESSSAREEQTQSGKEQTRGSSFGYTQNTEHGVPASEKEQCSLL